jgi:hypothetical protein
MPAKRGDIKMERDPKWRDTLNRGQYGNYIVFNGTDVVKDGREVVIDCTSREENQPEG